PMDKNPRKVMFCRMPVRLPTVTKYGLLTAPTMKKRTSAARMPSSSKAVRRRRKPRLSPLSGVSTFAIDDIASERPGIGGQRLSGEGTAGAGHLRPDIMAVDDADRLGEGVLDPRDVFEHRRRGMPVGEVDMHLAHVADMGADGQAARMRRVGDLDVFGDA